MRADNEAIIRELHQKAASHYLQGELDPAAQAWRQVLLLDPSDERALEGVRLCESMDAREERPSPERGVAVRDERYDPQVDQDLEASLEVLDRVLGDGEEAPAAVSAAPGQDGGDLEIDLSGLGAGAEPPPRDELDVLDEPAVPAAVRSPAEPLVERARERRAQGQAQEALDLLAQAVRLDAGNGAAHGLIREIRNELDGPAAATRPPLAAPQPGLPDPEDGPLVPRPPLFRSRPGPGPRDVEDELPERRPDPLRDEGGDSEIDEGDDDGIVVSDDGHGATGSPAAAAKRPAAVPPKSRPSAAAWVGRLRDAPKWAWGAAGIFVAALAIATFALRGSAGPGDEGAAAHGAPPEAPVPLPPATAPVAEVAAAPAPAAGEVAPAAAEPPLAAPLDERAAAEALARARTAAASGDLEGAVLAYGELLAAAPDHAIAREELRVVAEQYRQVRQREERWAAAIEAFQRGDYRTALTAFYRIEEVDDPSRLRRYVRNGWYNLGIQALRIGQCRTALEHLGEAAAIDASDAGVRDALALARDCRVGDAGGRAALRELPLRGLDD